MSKSGVQGDLLVFLDQAGRGCISGRVSEWPQLKPACSMAYSELLAHRDLEAKLWELVERMRSVANAAEILSIGTAKTAYRAAADELESLLIKCGDGGGFPSRQIPTDVTSREFSDWLTDQYRLAMNKGFQFARQDQHSAIDAATADLRRELADWQSFAAYCRCCAESGESDPQTFDEFCAALKAAKGES